jgi:hypothetical protein
MPCRDIITESEVLRAHHIASQNLTGTLCREPNCEYDRRYDVIDLKNNDNESVLDIEIAFECFKENRLWGTQGRGKVAKLHNIRIKPDKKSIGLGKDLHIQQLSVLRAQNFNELQLSAQWDGVIAWPSLLFKFQNEDDEDELLEHISNYMLDVLDYNIKKVARIMSTYDGIPSISKLLKPNDKDWFTKWYQETDRSLEFKMYKEVA